MFSNYSRPTGQEKQQQQPTSSATNAIIRKTRHTVVFYFIEIKKGTLPCTHVRKDRGGETSSYRAGCAQRPKDIKMSQTLFEKKKKKNKTQTPPKPQMSTHIGRGHS